MRKILEKVGIKRIDVLLIGYFIPPFLGAFFIALFILLMQNIWVYIDDIIGKGAGMLIILEMVGYMAITMIPLALPIGVLLSAVMVLGNMAEHHELTSLKSSGISLFRILSPLILVVSAIAAFSFFTSNNLIPVSQLQMRTRLMDIQRQKPTLSLDEGVFNEDFDGFSIRIGKKYENGRIGEILIYDHTKSHTGLMNLIKADSGRMFITDDGRYFVMQLYDGEQIQELERQGRQTRPPIMSSTFKNFEKRFNLDEFKIKRSDEELFKDHHSMLSTGQLLTAIDTIRQRLDRSRNRMIYNAVKFNSEGDKQLLADEHLTGETSESKVDTAIQSVPPTEEKTQKPPYQMTQAHITLLSLEERPDNAGSFEELFSEQDRVPLRVSTLRSLRSARSIAFAASVATENLKENLIRHLYELHTKFSLTIICFVFLFIGGPMGAIVRKGGFGYPFLVSILFFAVFIILTIMFREFAQGQQFDPVWSAWMPTIIMTPLAFLVTLQASNDAKLLQTEKVWVWVKKKRKEKQLAYEA